MSTDTPLPNPRTQTQAQAPTARWLFLFAFATFNSLRIVAYLPTLATILASGHSDQHSLFTWVTFAGANATMAQWLYEQNGRRFNRAILVNTVNALMCAGIVIAVGWARMK